MNFIITLFALAFLTTCGYGIIKMFIKEDLPFSLFGAIPLSFGTGLALLAVLCNLIMLVGLHLSFMTINVPLLVVFIFALTQMRFKMKFNVHAFMDAFMGISWKEWILILIIAFGIISVFLMSIAFPLHFWDSRAIWGTKAKMLFFSGTVHSSAFTDAYRINAHPRYPLLFPLSEAYIYISLGRADDWAVMLLTGILFPFIVIFLYDLARVYLKDRENALIAAAMVAVLPVFFMSDGPVTSGYADPPLAMLYCLSLGVTLLWKRNKNLGYLILSAFLSGVLMLTKNEGANMILLNMFLIVLPGDLNLKKLRLKDLAVDILIFVAIVLLIVVPWILLISPLPVSSDIVDISSINYSNVLNNIAKMPDILSGTVNAFIGLQKNMLGQRFLWCFLWELFIITSIISFIFRYADAATLSLITIAYVLITTFQWIILPTGVVGEAVVHVFRQYQGINALVALQIASTLKYLGSNDSQNR